MWDAVVRKDPGSCSMGRGLCAELMLFSSPATGTDEECFLVQSLHNSFLKCSEEQISTHAQHLLNRFWTTTSLLSLTGVHCAWHGMEAVEGFINTAASVPFPERDPLKKKIITQIIWQLLYTKERRTQWNLLRLRQRRSFKIALPWKNLLKVFNYLFKQNHPVPCNHMSCVVWIFAGVKGNGGLS